MRAVVQRVSQAQVEVEHQMTGAIAEGLLVLLGIHRPDGEKDLDWMVDKIAHLRIFEDEAGLMNRSLLDIGGQLLVVSQFTLCGDCRKGRRPSWNDAAQPDRPGSGTTGSSNPADSAASPPKRGCSGHDGCSLDKRRPCHHLLDSHKLF